jgi:glucose-6-phosphate 1-epimerase
MTEVPDPCADVVVTAADGAVLAVRPHGGHVIRWRPAGGPEVLWLSRDARCGPGQAIRGGIPVCWPQFADRGALPKHGFARDRPWTLVAAGPDGDSAARADLRLVDDGATRAVWPHRFALRLVAHAEADELEIALTARNTGEEPWEFTGALHAYLAVGSVHGTRVDGVGGATAEDNASGRARRTLEHGPLATDPPLDLAVRDVRGAVSSRLPDGSRIDLDRGGLPDVVVWNSGPDAPSDVHAEGWSEFLCVEPAALDPVTVAPGETWSATARWRWSPQG